MDWDEFHISSAICAQKKKDLLLDNLVLLQLIISNAVKNHQHTQNVKHRSATTKCIMKQGSQKNE